MKKLRCVIVDDEPVARKVLREFAVQVPFLELVAEFENVARTEVFLEREGADLLFLDIEMPKRSGLQYLKSAPERGEVPCQWQGRSPRPLVILTTAFPQYALEGYELDIIDYLLKPVAFSRFLKAVHKAREFAESREAVSTTPSLDSWLFVRSEKRIERIEMRDILYIQSLGNYVTIHTASKKILAYLTLKGLEGQLPAGEFIKIHQSYLVGLSKIDSIHGNQIVVGNKSLPLSRNYRDAVMRVVEKRMLKR
jgi:two-component system, LytTR family, response regulator